MIFQDKKILFSTPKNCIENLLANINFVENKDEKITLIVPSKELVTSLTEIIPKKEKTKINLLEFNQFVSEISYESNSKNKLGTLTNSQHYHMVQKSIKNSKLDSLDFNDSNTLFENLKESIETFTNIPNPALTKLKNQNLNITNYAIKIFEIYQKLKSQYIDSNQLLVKAISEIQSNNIKLHNKIGHIIFFLDRYHLENEIKFISLILKNFPSNLLVITQNQKSIDNLTKKYSLNPAEIQIDHIKNKITTNYEIVIAKNQIEEVKQAIRKILFAVNNGTKLSEIALIFDEEFPYLDIIKTQLNSAKIPYTGHIENKLLNTGPGQVLIGLLEIIESGISYEKFSNWISNSPVNIFYKNSDPNEWNEISKKIGIESNFNTWKNKLYSYVDQTKNSAPSSCQKALQLIKFLEHLKNDIDSIPKYNFKNKDIDLISLFFNKYLDKTKIPNIEKDSYSEIQNRILEIKKIEKLQVHFLEIKKIILNNLNEKISSTNINQKGIFISSIKNIIGMHFEYIHVLGLSEEKFLQQKQENPFISDFSKIICGGKTVGLPTNSEIHQIKKTDFEIISSIPQKLILSYPKNDIENHEILSPSILLKNIAKSIDHECFSNSQKLNPNNKNWLQIIDSKQSGLNFGQQTCFINKNELEEYILLEAKKYKIPFQKIPFLYKSESLKNYLLMSKSIESPKFGQWDGKINFSNIISKRTKIESYAKCPYQYFLNELIKIQPKNSDEETLFIDPKEKGSLQHKILEQFFKTVLSENTQPQINEKWNQKHQEVLTKIIEKNFSLWEEEGKTGKKIFWDFTKTEIRSTLATFLREEKKLREKFQVKLFDSEKSFGVEENLSDKKSSWNSANMEVENSKKTLDFRGFIDLIYLSADLKTALILDIKTGKSITYNKIKNNPIDGGQNLQLPVYSLAVSQNLNQINSILSSYWVATFEGGFKLYPEIPIKWTEIQEEFSKILEILYKSNLNGLFPANPGKYDSFNKKGLNCNFCDFDQICSENRIDLWERKSKSDPALKEFININTNIPE
ncbi:MAG: hypothetical protein FI687_01130 [SAR202 cluster bacterium]|nr:hypothetical protein [SAR202 cluster bacterium]|tara:strand:- start:12896 stop:15979 length:3084 start_codon:yes stop_codon:yes gene_type:complete